jgi:Zn-dependent protease
MGFGLGGIVIRFLDKPITMMICAIIMIMTLILHNIVQAYVASRFGDNTARFSGFMRFDPQQHLEPIGVLLLFIFGFGWGRTIPTSSRSYRGRGKQELWVWYSGPLTFFTVALLCSIAAAIFARLGQGDLMEAFGAAAFYCLLHAATHLIPILPLDGGKAAMIWGNSSVRRLIQQAASFPYSFMLIFIVLYAIGIMPSIIRFLATLIAILMSLIPGLRA